MTNYERIKNMSVEEMAEALDVLTPCEHCKYNHKCGQGYPDRVCEQGIKQWLESEVTE